MFQIHSKNVTAAVFLKIFLMGPKNILKTVKLKEVESPESASEHRCDHQRKKRLNVTIKSTLDSAERAESDKGSGSMKGDLIGNSAKY